MPTILPWWLTDWNIDDCVAESNLQPWFLIFLGTLAMLVTSYSLITAAVKKQEAKIKKNDYQNSTREIISYHKSSEVLIPAPL